MDHPNIIKLIEVVETKEILVLVRGFLGQLSPFLHLFGCLARIPPAERSPHLGVLPCRKPIEPRMSDLCLENGLQAKHDVGMVAIGQGTVAQAARFLRNNPDSFTGPGAVELWVDADPEVRSTYTMLGSVNILPFHSISRSFLPLFSLLVRSGRSRCRH